MVFSLVFFNQNLLYISVFSTVNFYCSFHGSGALTCYDSELTSENLKPSRYLGRTLWMGDRPIARPLPANDSTTQKNADIRPRLKRDSNT